MDYPTADELTRMGATLTRDVNLWTPRLAREYHTGDYSRPNVPTSLTKPAPLPEREFHSMYIGVSVYKERWWISCWTSNGKPVRGRKCPRTEQGEVWAARDRARGLDREYIERRDGTRIPYPWKSYEEMDDAA